MSRVNGIYAENLNKSGQGRSNWATVYVYNDVPRWVLQNLPSYEIALGIASEVNAVLARVGDPNIRLEKVVQ